MYKEYRWPEKDNYKAAAKQQELQKTYGVKIPVYKIENGRGERFLSMVFPDGLIPINKKAKIDF